MAISLYWLCPPASVFLVFYYNCSPILIFIACYLLFVNTSGNPPRPARESVPPVFDEGDAAGLHWGVTALQGRRPYMEDLHQIAHFDGDSANDAQLAGEGAAAAARVGLTHFFGVFDGHGGKRAAMYVRNVLVSRLLSAIDSKCAAAAPARQQERQQERLLDEACVEAFLATDSEFLRYAKQHAIPDGSTAVCCLLQRCGLTPSAQCGFGDASEGRRGAGEGSWRLLVANVGDSRCAMIKRDGSALPLSRDHKPNVPAEKARVEASGGQVIFAGCWRVQGDLAVSRAFGDCHLKRFGVSAEPELTVFHVDMATDRFLVLASDGLWDVMDESQCAEVVLRAEDTLLASRTLCDLATSRGSMDNITALVVDLDTLSRL